MPAKPHKGIWLSLTLETGESHDITGISTVSEALYLMKRRYMSTPGLKRVFMFVGTKALGELRLAKGVLNMTTGTFEAFNAENSDLTKQFLPYATGTDKETISAFELPFYITGFRTRVSQFPDPDTGEDKNEILYNIEMDTTHEGYKYASRNKDLKTGYCLTLSENVFRVRLNEQLIQPAIDAGTPMRARLVKRGRAWSFVDAPRKD